ncbi:hypothetical protein [Curtobacterium flaccumfaciens]|uniref:hypothetical protein n=1 Tax=Curtobacterium flaccumfaciens TaxID=2035 RepID=UPI001BDFE97B|nr:hypothetical protein [Curtobacterium flaccumfaciens]MBT1585790.1 hypothetical protein [Curtobacterium flaccumfaciens pv. flaccumfaciens]MCX2799988.1 hypothetical protein [Curtobacterium flaccumfaciens pv. flaccumfaciens]
MTSQDEARDQLQQVAADIERLRSELDDAISQRYDIVEAARAAGITWREAATILKMTETGLMKTQGTTKKARAKS